ncbi:MAG: UDP-3-O-(3-hydroxymyristoyl)glucosamine N-acyltransferase [Elusimicrobiales bacterium]
MKLKLSEIAAITGGELEGRPDDFVRGPASIENAPEGSLVYLADFSKKGSLAGSKAACAILPKAAKGLERPFSGGVIYAEDPHWAFTLVLRHVQKAERPAPPAGIHPSAVIDPSASIGAGVYIGAHCVVEKNASVGAGSALYPNCYIGENASLGENCVFHPGVVFLRDCVAGDRVVIHGNAVIGADGFGYIRRGVVQEKIPQLGNVVIENDVEIGAATTIDRAALTQTRVGAGSKIDNLVQIAHNVNIGRNCIIVSQAGVAGSSRLGDNVVVAGQAGIVDHVKIGNGAIVTAGTGIMSDVPDGAVMFGSPARPHAQMLKIVAILGKLPEMYAFFRKLKKKFGEE